MAQLGKEGMQRLHREVERIVDREGMQLVDLEFKREGDWVLRIYIDKDGGVNLDDCALISGQVGMMLDVEEMITGSYNLEVSSPGIERPLKKLEDYRRFEGRLARVRLKPDVQGRKKFRGRLAGIEGEDVLLDDEVEGRTHRLSLGLIYSARLEVEM